MKKPLYFLIFSICLTFFVSSTSKKEAFHPKKVGLVSTSNNLWIDKNEVSLMDYAEFLYSVNNGNYIPKIAKEQLFIDTAKISSALCFKEKNRSLIPLLGATREIAEEYCRFRTWAISKSFEGKLPKGNFRLLNEEEVKSAIGNDPENINCILPINRKVNKIVNLSNNADELLSDGKAIIGGKIVSDIEVNIELTGFRCCLEY